MCLENVDLHPIRKFGVGYKLVQTDGKGNYYSWDFIPSYESKFRYKFEDEWFVDPSEFDGDNVDKGFHIITNTNERNLCDSFDLTTCHNGMYKVWIKIRFKDVVATGKTYSYTKDKYETVVVVAKQIKFISEVK